MSTLEKRLVNYKVIGQPLGENQVDDCLSLEEEHGEELVKMGLVVHATPDDLQRVEDEEDKEQHQIMEQTPTTVEAAVTDLMSKAINTIPVTNTVPAEPQGPVYHKVPGVSPYAQYTLDILKSWLPNRGSKYNTNANRARAFERKQAESYENTYYQENDDGTLSKAISGINETTNASGLYLVNPEFSSEVYSLPHSQISLEELAGKKMDAKSNVLNYRMINESSWANASIFGGLNMANTAEGGVFASSLPAWTNKVFTLLKFGLFLYYTSEFLEDATNFYPVLSDIDEYVRKAFLFGVNTQIIQGTSLEGIINAAATITVTKNSNDTAYASAPQTCLTYEDITNMWSRLLPDSKVSEKTVFLYHPGLETSLNYMSFHFVSSGNANPAMGYDFNAADPAGQRGANGGWLSPSRVMGRPAYPCAAMAAPGAAGDCGFFDFGQVAVYRKPFRIERSTEFHFSHDEVAARYISRLDCKLLTPAAVTMPSGATTYSPSVIRTSAGT